MGFAKILGVKDELVETAGRAPSLLNGGLEENQIPWFLLTVGMVASLAEIFTAKLKEDNPGMYGPGDMGFDPFGLFPTDAATQDQYKLAELKHGRVAMLAIAAIVLEEAISGTSFLKEDISTDLSSLAQDVVKEVDFYEAAISPTAKP